MASKEKQQAKAELKNAKRARKAEEKRDKKMYGKGEEGRRAKMAAQAQEAAKKKAARAATRAISSVDTDTSTEGASMSGKKYDAKEAYNKNLTASARLHYLENERHDKTSRPSIHKHMRNFGVSMKNYNMGASMKGTPPGSRMQNLAKKAMNNRPAQYTDSGQNFKDANNKFVSGLQVDEGQLSKVIRKSPERPYVMAKPGALKNQKTKEKLYLTKNKK